MRNLFLFMLSIVFFASCDTELVEVDADYPEVSIQIVGTGVDFLLTNEMNQLDYEIRLLEHNEYQFIFTANDGGTGGMQNFIYYTDIKNLERLSELPDIFTSVIVDNPGSTRDFEQIDWQGDPGNPLTGMIAVGNYKTKSSGQFGKLSSFLNVEGMDFPDGDGTNNQTALFTNIYIVNEDPGVVELY